MLFRYLLAESSVTPGQEADAWVFAGTLSGYASLGAQVATGTLMYEPWTNLYVATEYFWGRQVLFNGQSGQDHRLNLVFRYMFNR